MAVLSPRSSLLGPGILQLQDRSQQHPQFRSRVDQCNNYRMLNSGSTKRQPIKLSIFGILGYSGNSRHQHLGNNNSQQNSSGPCELSRIICKLVEIQFWWWECQSSDDFLLLSVDNWSKRTGLWKCDILVDTQPSYILFKLLRPSINVHILAEGIIRWEFFNLYDRSEGCYLSCGKSS